MTPDASATWPLPPAYDFFETTRLLRTGPRDPTLRREPDGLWRTTITAGGPVTVRLRVADALHAETWGPGAAAAIGDVPRWVGLHEPPWQLPAHPGIARLLSRFRGLRGTDTRNVFEALTVSILQQRVTWEEAASAWRRLCERLGEPAPGPVDMRVPPAPRAVRLAGTARLFDAGVGSRQARTLIEVALSARALQKVADLPTEEAAALMQTVRGVGPWTAAMALGLRLGRPEPIPVGDFHLPHAVAWALAGEPRGNDQRMLDLLSPFPGQAFRVIRLLLAARISTPARGPRRASPRRWR